MSQIQQGMLLFGDGQGENADSSENSESSEIFFQFFLVRLFVFPLCQIRKHGQNFPRFRKHGQNYPRFRKHGQNYPCFRKIGKYFPRFRKHGKYFPIFRKHGKCCHWQLYTNFLKKLKIWTGPESFLKLSNFFEYSGFLASVSNVP